jgi:glutamate mutase epsilon subunit
MEEGREKEHYFFKSRVRVQLQSCTSGNPSVRWWSYLNRLVTFHRWIGINLFQHLMQAFSTTNMYPVILSVIQLRLRALALGSGVL